MKKCSVCGVLKSFNDFHKRKNRPCGVQPQCKKCSTVRVNKWHDENKERRIIYVQKRQAENGDKVRAIRRKSHANHNNEKARLVNAVKCGMYKHLKKGSKAGRHWEDLVGYKVDQLKRRLERLFLPGMSWENYGTVWEIDHIIPIAAFNFETPNNLDFKRCWSLKNLQPLETIKNMSKGASLGKPFQPSLKLSI